MTQLSRRTFIASLAAASGARLVPGAVQAVKSRRILTLVYDKSLGAMRAVERVVR